LKILAIDTSSQACSVCIVEDGFLLSESYINTGLTHSRTLSPMVKKTLDQVNLKASDINLVAVSEGPGSYTGLRIGMAEAKGFAFSNNLPCVSVSTLLSLAQNVINYDGFVVAALDARVNQFYCAIFKIKDQKIERITEDSALKFEELEKILPDKFLVVGDGAKLLASKVKDKEILLAPANLSYQRASSIALLALDSNQVTASQLVPNYHRKSQAEREKENNV